MAKNYTKNLDSLKHRVQDQFNKLKKIILFDMFNVYNDAIVWVVNEVL